MNRLLGLCIATALSTGLAHSFDGALVGAELGATYVRADHIYFEGTNSGENSISKLGFFTGGFANYLHEIGNSKTFIGGGVHLSTAFYEEKCSFGIDGQPVRGIVKIQRKLGIKPTVMVGKLVNPKVMVFGSIGYEFAKFDFDYTFNAGNPVTSLSGVSSKVSKNIKAIVPGAGVLYKVSNNFIVGAEYNYAAYGKEDIRSTLATDGSTRLKTRADISEHRILARLAFRFCPF